MDIIEGSKWYSPRSDRVYKVYTIGKVVWVEVIKLAKRDLVHVGDCWRWGGLFPDFLIPYHSENKES